MAICRATPKRSAGLPTTPICYAFEAIPGTKSSYNVNKDLGNWTALKLFRDPSYVAEHSPLPGYHQVVDRGIDQAWGTAIWPTGFPPDEKASVNGFVMEADFYKFRGRGVIQTTGRSDYGVLVQYILDNATNLGNATLNELKATWDAYPTTTATKLDVIDAVNVGVSTWIGRQIARDQHTSSISRGADLEEIGGQPPNKIGRHAAGPIFAGFGSPGTPAMDYIADYIEGYTLRHLHTLASRRRCFSRVFEG